MNQSENKKWLPTDDRFVVFIDIMGFKDLVARNTHDYIYNMLSDISVSRMSIENSEQVRDDSGEQKIYIDNTIDVYNSLRASDK